ncbi:MAG: response regulator transcription factor [Calditrichia bacterium]
MQKEKEPTFRILVVEDEETLARGLQFNLVAEGYEVDLARDGKEAMEKLESGRYHLIILDVMLPYMDGFEIAGQVREKDLQQPILFLTARKAQQDKLEGLQLGADDYITKPFHLQELLLRVKRILQRQEWYSPPGDLNSIAFGGWEIQFDTLKARKGDSEFQLTPQEARLIKYFYQNANRVISRSELLENVWETPGDLETRTVDIFLSRLRKYFEENPSQPRHFISIRGAGYMFRKE